MSPPLLVFQNLLPGYLPAQDLNTLSLVSRSLRKAAVPILFRDIALEGDSFDSLKDAMARKVVGLPSLAQRLDWTLSASPNAGDEFEEKGGGEEERAAECIALLGHMLSTHPNLRRISLTSHSSLPILNLSPVFARLLEGDTAKTDAPSSFVSTKSLQYLSLSGFAIDSITLESVLAASPDLQHLTLQTFDTPAAVNELVPTSLPPQGLSNSTIHHLLSFTGLASHLPAIVSEGCRSLGTISVEMLGAPLDDLLRSLEALPVRYGPQGLRSLEILGLDSILAEEEGFISRLGVALADKGQLESLELGFSDELSDEFIFASLASISSIPSLSTLTLHGVTTSMVDNSSNARHLTQPQLKALSVSFPRLASLTINKDQWRFLCPEAAAAPTVINIDGSLASRFVRRTTASVASSSSTSSAAQAVTCDWLKSAAQESWNSSLDEAEDELDDRMTAVLS